MCDFAIRESAGAWQTIREDELVARVTRINTTEARLQAFAIGATPIVALPEVFPRFQLIVCSASGSP